MRILALINFLLFAFYVFGEQASPLTVPVVSPQVTLLTESAPTRLVPVPSESQVKSIDITALPMSAKSASLVASPAAPPNWAQELMLVAEKLPMVGPFITKGLLYLGILSSIMTVLVGTALTIINSLAGLFTASGLVNAANAIIKFRDGPIMYWLKFLSLFNAQKAKVDPPMPPPAVS